MLEHAVNIYNDLTDDEKLIVQTARDFAQKELAPVAEEIDRKESIPPDIIKRMSELGFMGVQAPQDYGGPGLNNLSLTLIQIEINSVCASTGTMMSVQNSLAISPILKFGTEEQKKCYLPKLASGEMIGAYSLTEPSSGSDAASLVTNAILSGDHYVLNGAKVFVTNGGIADLFIVFARTNPDRSLRAKGISTFLVERGTRGMTIGKNEKKLGIKGSSTVQLFFEDCTVPALNMLGLEGEGFKIAMSTLDGGRISIAAQATGIARACLDASIKYAKQRTQFGKAIAEYEAIQWKIADMATDIEAATLLTLRAARLRDQDLPHTTEAAMAKLFAATMANKHAREAIQIHGGAGFIKDFPVERYFRDAKITEIYEGTSEIQRLVIARRLLELKG